MADLVLKIGTGSGYEDGDIVCAFNRRAIRAVHADRLCHPRHAGFTVSGLRPVGSLAQRYLERTSQYRFTRVSATEVQRLDLRTQVAEVLSGTPNAQGEYIDVGAFLARRVRYDAHRIFGTPGAELWYGGALDTSDPTLDGVWVEIESHSPYREAQFQGWPLTAVERRSFLPLAVNAFDDDTAAAYTAPEYDAAGAVLRKRRAWVDYANEPLIRARAALAAIRNPAVEIDLRVGAAFNRAALVRQKGRRP